MRLQRRPYSSSVCSTIKTGVLRQSAVLRVAYSHGRGAGGLLSMGKPVKVVAGIVLGYLLIALLIGALIAYFQPQREGTLILRTFDQSGQVHETVLRDIHDANGARWLWSAKWFRGWYYRALEHPHVEIVVDGKPTKQLAVEVTDAAEIERVVDSQRQGVNSLVWWLGRASVIFAPIRILHLEEDCET